MHAINKSIIALILLITIPTVLGGNNILSSILDNLLRIAQSFCPTCGQAKLVSIDQTSKTVQLNVGEILDIKVKENPSTGFIWMEEDTGNPKILLSLQNGFVGNNFTLDKNSTDMVGVGGQNHFYYKAIAPGTSRIKLAYRRSWENSNITSYELEAKIV